MDTYKNRQLLLAESIFVTWTPNTLRHALACQLFFYETTLFIMKTINLIFIFLIGMTLSQPAFSGTLTNGQVELDLNAENLIISTDRELAGTTIIETVGEITLLNPNISVEGNIYLDYSVFSEYAGFVTSGFVSLHAESVYIFPDSMKHYISDITDLLIYDSVPDSYNGISDTLFFGNPAIIDGQFSATENIYIADFSHYSELAVTSVPLPAAFWFFISGLSILMRGRFKSWFLFQKKAA